MLFISNCDNLQAQGGVDLNNLKKLRIKSGKNQRELAADLNVAQNTISQWELGTRDIDSTNILALVNYFGVSADDLLGHSPFSEHQLETIKENIEYLEDQSSLWEGISPQEYDGGAFQDLLDDIKSGKVIPTYSTVHHIADEFQCDVREILFTHEEQLKTIKNPDNITVTGLSDKKQAFIKKLSMVDDSAIAALEGVLDLALGKQAE